MNEKKLTDEEIIKALEIGSKCCEHNYLEYWELVGTCQNALDLIHRLQAENAGLKSELKRELAEHEEFTKKAKTEIERLTEEKTESAKTAVEVIEQNIELQKQVDELKEENGKLVTIGNRFALERNNLREELDELKKKLRKIKQDMMTYHVTTIAEVVKDAVPLAIQRFINQLHIDKIIRVDSDLGKELLKEKEFVLKRYYSVEVE